MLVKLKPIEECGLNIQDKNTTILKEYIKKNKVIEIIPSHLKPSVYVWRHRGIQIYILRNMIEKILDPKKDSMHFI